MAFKKIWQQCPSSILKSFDWTIMKHGTNDYGHNILAKIDKQPDKLN